jgi:hypothetical protein
VIIISPSLLSIEEYIVIIPFEIEEIRKIDTIEKIKLRKIRVVFNLFASKALSENAIKDYPFIFFVSLIFEYE